ncbi:hypothetical protein [Caballeronia calidae]|uniref:hypothetical protein n=1 Tax=Caballeronia calidae TaxID=1777139 RepID=UPI0018E007CA|nr:hypothetical protein [Caballeronia calidae]
MTGRVAPPSPGGFLFHAIERQPFHRVIRTSVGTRHAAGANKKADRAIRFYHLGVGDERSVRDRTIDNRLTVDHNERTGRTMIRGNGGRRVIGARAGLLLDAASDARLSQCTAIDLNHLLEPHSHFGHSGRDETGYTRHLPCHASLESIWITNRMAGMT